MPSSTAPHGLDALQVEVDRPGRHPLAILTHGTSSDEQARKALTPWMFLPQATWFARRGYVVLVVVRRGYGRSSGEMDTTGLCAANGSTPLQVAERGADDLRAAAKFAETMPEVDTSTIVSAGVSTGGLAEVALAADPPRGLKAAINFAGGVGTDGKGQNCDLKGLVSAFEQLGRQVKVPMLWIYAENDRSYPPAMVRQFDAAFRAGGGKAQLVMAPPYREDGHGYFASSSSWTPAVEDFLKPHGLLPLAEMLPDPAILQTPTPPGLGTSGLMGFHSFLTAGPFKAFASTGNGGWGMSVQQQDQATADRKAMEACQRSKPAQQGATCSIVTRTE